MEIYVDELPKSCLNCPCIQTDGCVCWCGSNAKPYVTKDNLYVECGERHEKCPLQSLANHDKRVRKEVLDIIDEKFNCFGYVEEKFDDIKKYVLDRIQGETK